MIETLPDKPQGLANDNVLSVLNLLVPEQIEELQVIAERGDESPTVSERLSQMVSNLAGGNSNIQRAMAEARESAAEKFANLLATPLYKLAKDTDLDLDDKID